MTKKLSLLIFFFLLLTTSPVRSQVIVDDDFESYADLTALQTRWVSTSGSTTSTDLIDTSDPFNPNDPNNPYPVLPTRGGLDGKAAIFDASTSNGAGSVNEWVDPNGNSFAIGFDPNSDPNRTIELSVDLGYDLTGDKRTTLGLRYFDPNSGVSGLTDNIIELGFYNNFPAGPNGEIYQFGYRSVLFPGSTNWQAFSSLPFGLDQGFEVEIAGNGSPAFHRFGAIIDASSVTFTLDMFADGVISFADADFNGDDVVDGKDFLIWQRNVGTTGDPNTGRPDGDANRDFTVDAADLAIWEEEYGIVVGVTPGFDAVDVVNAQVDLYDGVAFNNIRFGGPSGLSSTNSFLAIDNVLLEVIGNTPSIQELATIPEPSSALLWALAAIGTTVASRRRRH